MLLDTKVTRQTRISAAGIIIHDGKILLVRYSDRPGESYLVGPGGGLKDENEKVTDALIREVMEETGLEVAPEKLLFVEDLLSRNYRMLKIWFLCRVVRGEARMTPGAIAEGITGVGWYSRNDLAHETVYPPPLLAEDWESFAKPDYKAIYLDLRTADF